MLTQSSPFHCFRLRLLSRDRSRFLLTLSVNKEWNLERHEIEALLKYAALPSQDDVAHKKRKKSCTRMLCSLAGDARLAPFNCA